MIFSRRIPKALTADATLQIYAGTYSTPSGGKLEVVFRPGEGLVIPGGAGIALMPWRPHQFRLKEFPDVVITFTLQDGKVIAMRRRDPSGEFVFPRLP